MEHKDVKNGNRNIIPFDTLMHPCRQPTKIRPHSADNWHIENAVHRSLNYFSGISVPVTVQRGLKFQYLRGGDVVDAYIRPAVYCQLSFPETMDNHSVSKDIPPMLIRSRTVVALIPVLLFSALAQSEIPTGWKNLPKLFSKSHTLVSFVHNV